jgi:SAM-dependent methyltransferase
MLDSNQRPPACEAGALPTELIDRDERFYVRGPTASTERDGDARATTRRADDGRRHGGPEHRARLGPGGATDVGWRRERAHPRPGLHAIGTRGLVSVTPLELEVVACPLCRASDATVLCTERDLALGVPGRFPLSRCEGCGLLYQNPRVHRAQLDRMYPADYPPHARNPDLGRALRDRSPGVRRLLARRLGYRHLEPGAIGLGDRVRTRLRRRRILKDFPPWIGSGRLLDVGCATGRFLQHMAAVGWRVSGIELDPEAAATARTVTAEITVGDPADVTLPRASFDLVTAFHVVEHLPDPAGAVRNMLAWLAPDGLLVIEVPNVGGWGGALFGRYWSGLDFPRHLIHFTPATMRALVAQCGGRVVEEWHWSKPRWIIRSARFWLAARPGVAASGALAALDSRLGGGVAKLALELTLKAAGPARRGEVVRYFIRHGGEAACAS